MVAKEDDIWEDVLPVLDRDEFCTTCKISTIRRANTRHSELYEDASIKPGSHVFVDIQHNTALYGLTEKSHFTYYVLLVDVYSRFAVLYGINRLQAEDLANVLQAFATYYGPHVNYNLSMLSRLHADAGSQFTSEHFLDFCRSKSIAVDLAAPHHQEMNGVVESAWKVVRLLARSFMVEARVGEAFQDFAYEHAWKVYNFLPLRSLTLNGRATSPYELYYGHKPRISKLRVLFCPCVLKTHTATAKRPGSDSVRVFTDKNNAQRGLQGIFVGLPRHQAGYICYIPSTAEIRVSADVVFDENFESTMGYSERLFSSAMPTVGVSLPLSADSDEDISVEFVGPPPTPPLKILTTDRISNGTFFASLPRLGPVKTNLSLPVTTLMTPLVVLPSSLILFCLLLFHLHLPQTSFHRQRRLHQPILTKPSISINLPRLNERAPVEPSIVLPGIFIRLA
jgi:Integrase core domain